MKQNKKSSRTSGYLIRLRLALTPLLYVSRVMSKESLGLGLQPEDKIQNKKTEQIICTVKNIL